MPDDKWSHAAHMQNQRQEEQVERSGPSFDPPVYVQRYTMVRDIMFKHPGVLKVVDFGCAEGRFLRFLKNIPFLEEIAAVDIKQSCLLQAVRHAMPVAWDFLYKRNRPLSIKLYEGNVAEPDARIQGFDAVSCIELIEHLMPDDLEKLPHSIFHVIRPKIAIMTTPNREFNVLYPSLKGFRNWDHKFEWDREEFRTWCLGITQKYPEYTVEIMGVGDAPPEHAHLGSCSQLAVFRWTSDLSTTSHSEISQPFCLVDEFLYPGRAVKDVHMTVDACP